MSVSTLAPSRATPVAALKSWTPWQAANSSLVGHAEVIFAGGWIVSGIPVFRRSDGSLSVGQPNAAQLDRDGRVKTDASGKRVYAQVISFATAAAKARWQDAVSTALRDGGIALNAITQDMQP